MIFRVICTVFINFACRICILYIVYVIFVIFVLFYVKTFSMVYSAQPANYFTAIFVFTNFSIYREIFCSLSLQSYRPRMCETITRVIEMLTILIFQCIQNVYYGVYITNNFAEIHLLHREFNSLF